MGDGDHVEPNAPSHVLLVEIRLGEWKNIVNVNIFDVVNVIVEVVVDYYYLYVVW